MYILEKMNVQKQVLTKEKVEALKEKGYKLVREEKAKGGVATEKTGGK